jgi:vacuolar-type H+-ATPase subunit F/Vma7
MAYGVRAICRPELGAGFALAGVSTVEVADAGEAEARLHELMKQKDVGVLLVEDDLLPAEGVPGAARRPLPMIVPVPAGRPGGADDAAAYVAELLRRAIGYRVRLK